MNLSPEAIKPFLIKPNFERWPSFLEFFNTLNIQLVRFWGDLLVYCVLL